MLNSSTPWVDIRITSLLDQLNQLTAERYRRLARLTEQEELEEEVVKDEAIY